MEARVAARACRQRAGGARGAVGVEAVSLFDFAGVERGAGQAVERARLAETDGSVQEARMSAGKGQFRENGGEGWELKGGRSASGTVEESD